MKNRYLSLLFIIATLSIGEAIFKVYPILFAAFSLFYLASGFKLKKSIAIPAGLFWLSATLFTLLNLEKTFDLTSYIKITINFIFLASAGSYLMSLPKEKSLQLLRTSSAAFIAISFIQAFISVYANSLWLLPFSLENSTTSYLIQNTPILFGDQSKNIWASKIAIFLIAFSCCHYLERKRNLLYSTTYVFALFILLYVSSRTAQLAVLTFIAAIAYYHFWIVKRQRFILIALGALCLPVLGYIGQLIIRVDYGTLANFNYAFQSHMGDGLLSRLIIWSHVFNSTNISDYLWGNGILSFSYYTGNIFSESNPHNIFLNIILDFGIITFALYILLLYRVFKNSALSRLLFVPFLIFANSQYLGYDNDLVIYFLIALTLSTQVSTAKSTIR